MTKKVKEPNNKFLNQIYKELDYNSGDLIDVATPKYDLDAEVYLAKGQWLETCDSINKKTDQFKIDKLFFVQENPVIVFVDASKRQKGEIFKVFNSVWSLARPRLVFIENSTSVTIYDLASAPAKSDDELEPLVEIIKETKLILEELNKFDRQNIESGLVFGDNRFESINNRADQALISDLKQVRRKLFDLGLNGDKLKFAHALIGRSIFIRYLEDRGILTSDYFKELAKNEPGLLKIVETPLNEIFYREEMRELIYPRILSSITLTFRLFKKVAKDFNGDTFTTDSDEERIIEQSHLDLLQNFLIGARSNSQQSLFLWAYRFDVVPIDLISSIYEEFYHSENLIDEKTQKLKEGKGTHYTPSSLVEFVLSRTLTLKELKRKPKVMDPACGSGIFLVESFRRMVRYELHSKSNSTLTLEELLSILKNQIAGIEINPEAIKIAAFSLYLSLLHYLNPPSILAYIKKGSKLPYLIYHGKSNDNHFNILLKCNAFDENMTNVVFKRASFDIIVGNPPWGTPRINDIKGRKDLEIIVEWCEKKGVEFPDKEPSHAFLWRALDFLKPNGISSLLVSGGALLKFSKPSNAFKQQILSKTTFREVINFSNIRRVFFSSAISPFFLIKLKNTSPQVNSMITYLSIKKSEIIEKNKIVLINNNDFKWIKYTHTSVNDIWKIYYWGNNYDFDLINSIRRFDSLKSYTDENICGQGFQIANKTKEATWLKNFKTIPVKFFSYKYNSIDLDSEQDKLKLEEVPSKVKLRGKKDFYNGQRILVRRGILQSIEPKGQIIARLETNKFAFNHSLICIKLQKNYEEYYEVIVGILWSSLFRYYMFMTASTWGTWRQEIHLNEVLEFPIPIYHKGNYQLIRNVVNKLSKKSQEIVLQAKKNNPMCSEKEILPLILNNRSINDLQNELDELVYDIYQLTLFERNLIKDRCNLDIDLYYRGINSFGNQPIRDTSYLVDYIQAFKGFWKRQLDEHESFKHTFITTKDQLMIGVAFQLYSDQKNNNNLNLDIDLSEFDNFLNKEISRKVFTEGLLRRVSNNQILIIKRNRKSNWTKTEAKIDADATILEVLKAIEKT